LRVGVRGWPGQLLPEAVDHDPEVDVDDGHNDGIHLEYICSRLGTTSSYTFGGKKTTACQPRLGINAFSSGRFNEKSAISLFLNFTCNDSLSFIVLA
jgi:hypothetical protein